MRIYNFGFGGGNPFEEIFRAMGRAEGTSHSDQNRNTGSPPHRARPKTSRKGKIARVIAFLAALALGYYVVLPPMNIQSSECWSFVAVYLVLAWGLASTVSEGQTNNVYGTDGKPVQTPKKTVSLRRILGMVFAVGAAVYLLCTLLSSPLFQARNYASIIQDSMATKEIEEYTPTIDNVPLLDRDSAERLAQRALGNLVDEVSQFVLWDSNQVTVNGAPVRTQPLGYDGAIKWFLNRKVGIPAYITVDMKSQNTKIVRLKEGMRYSPSAYLNDRLERHLRFCYPTAMFGDYKFELDEDGNPYWVIPVLRHRIMLLSGTDVKGVVTCNPTTGETAYYPLGEIPDWIDNVYSADLIMQQYNWYGRYHNGFINSIIGQKGCVKTTEGYNYIPKGNDVYCYTGVTSVVSDDSNIGFIFSDLRTRETEYYEIAGAEEFSAMSSAEGLVQNLKYQATFPLLLNIHDQPTYTVALKDDAGLVKMYGMVNMAQYQDVVTGKTIKECLANYEKLLVDDGIIQPEEQEATTANEVEGKITDLRSAVRDGTTYYYLKLDDEKTYYSLNASDDESAVLLNVGDTVQLVVNDSKGKILAATRKD